MKKITLFLFSALFLTSQTPAQQQDSFWVFVPNVEENSGNTLTLKGKVVGASTMGYTFKHITYNRKDAKLPAWSLVYVIESEPNYSTIYINDSLNISICPIFYDYKNRLKTFQAAEWFNQHPRDWVLERIEIDTQKTSIIRDSVSRSFNLCWGNRTTRCAEEVYLISGDILMEYNINTAEMTIVFREVRVHDGIGTPEYHFPIDILKQKNK